MPHPTLILGPREIDLDRGEVRNRGEKVPLTPNEVKLLSVLAERMGEVVERDALMCAALGYNKAVMSRAIDQAVWRLRRKIEDEPHHPRWLLSEANVGYRLALAAPHEPTGRALPGREPEIRRLREMLAAHREVVIAGLPGTDRAALAKLAQSSGDSDGCTVHIADHMPSDPVIPVLRLSALPPEASVAVLTSAVLSARGAAALSDEEEVFIPILAERAGHHPGTLRALARASVLSHCSALSRSTLSHGQGPFEPDPRHVALIEALAPNIRDALSRCAVFPDAFTPEEVGLAPELLVSTWRALVLDAVPVESGERRFAVPPCIRALLTPAEDSRRSFVASVVQKVEPAALAALDGLDRDRIDAVVRMGPRVEQALSLASPEQTARLLTALLVRQFATGQLPAFLPAPSADLPPDDAAVAHLLHASQLELTDPKGALHAAKLSVSLAGESRGSPVIEATAIRAAFRLSLRASVGAADLETLLGALHSLAERSPTPFVAASRHHLRGLYALRGGSTDAARDELVAALALYGECSVASRLVWSNLAAEAARDGRVIEALAWSDRVPLAELPPSEEANERRRRATMLAASGDLPAAERELTMAEMLGAPPLSLQLDRATLSLLRGEIDEAVVLAESVSGRALSAEGDFACAMVLGWARLAQGMPELTLRIIERSHVALSYADYSAQIDLLKVAACARTGRTDEARVMLRSIAAPSRRWWPTARAMLGALIDACAGAPPDLLALQRELDRNTTVHLVSRFALAALRAWDPPISV